MSKVDSLPYEDETEVQVEFVNAPEKSPFDIFIVTIGGNEVLRGERRNYRSTNHAMMDAVDAYSRFLSL